MKRERATSLVTTALTAVAQARTRPLSMIDEIRVFGSFARGAFEPHDVDLDVELTPDEQFTAEMIERRRRRRDPFAPVRQALIGNRRGVDLHVSEAATLHESGIETTLLWRRGDDLDTALARVHAIEPDPEAGRAPRHAMLPAFEGIDRHVPFAVREMLCRWVDEGAVTVEQIELPGREASGEVARQTVERRWIATSVLRRAGNAALAHLEQQGVTAEQVHLHGSDVVDGSDPRHFVGFRWQYTYIMHMFLTRWGGIQWLEVPHPTTDGPVIAVRIEVVDRPALAARSAMRRGVAALNGSAAIQHAE